MYNYFCLIGTIVLMEKEEITIDVVKSNGTGTDTFVIKIPSYCNVEFSKGDSIFIKGSLGANGVLNGDKIIFFENK